jgi:hypothetical protein
MEPENTIENYFLRFTDVAISKFLNTELLILSQILPNDPEPRRSN